MSNAPSSSKLSWLERSASAELSSPPAPLRPFLPLLPPADDDEDRLRSCAAAKQASSLAWPPDAAVEEPGACSPRLNADLRSFCTPRFLAAALLPLLPASPAAAGALGGSAGGCCCGGLATACGRRVVGGPCRSAGCGAGGVGRPRHGLVLLFATGVWECMATEEGAGQCLVVCVESGRRARFIYGGGRRPGYVRAWRAPLLQFNQDQQGQPPTGIKLKRVGPPRSTAIRLPGEIKWRQLFP